jgi:hypothetical protein
MSERLAMDGGIKFDCTPVDASLLPLRRDAWVFGDSGRRHRRPGSNRRRQGAPALRGPSPHAVKWRADRDLPRARRPL